MAQPSSRVSAHNDAPPSPHLASLLDTALEAHEAGLLDRAETIYRETLAHDPRNTKALHLLGVLHYQRGDYDVAAGLMSHALKIDRSDAACWSNRGLVAASLGRLDEAMICYDQALQLQPDFADARNNFGVALQRQGSFEEAIEQYRLALASHPGAVDVHLNLGTALSKLGQYEEALACYRHALSLDPSAAEAHFNAGNIYTAQGDTAASIASFEQAIALRADYAEAHVNLGSAIGLRGDYAAAEKHFRRATALKPNPTNLVALGGSLGAQNRLDEEEAFYREALTRDPNYADAHQNLAWLLLKRGDFAQGWGEFAQRWRKKDYEALAVPGVAEWRGESLEGRTLLIVGEQGFGDHFQFLRFARVLEERGATVDLCVREPLLPLVGRIQGVRRAFSGKPEDEYDFWVPMMSIPCCIGLTLSTIPADIPYVFADKARVKAWRKRIGARAQPQKPGDAKAQARTTRRKIGIVWAGSPSFGNDRYRSVPLAELKNLAGIDPIDWYALQKDAAHAQLADAPPAFGAHDFTANLDNFEETAALIMNLDLVIAVDTGVAHLAGALGKPVWLLLPANSDWRWLEARSDTPWYPRMKLFRQKTLGDWATVVAEVGKALRKR